jgi:hypothetical protein
MSIKTSLMRAGEELLPFIAFAIRQRAMRAKMLGDDTPGSADMFAQYCTLGEKELEKRLLEERERAKALDEKTFRMTLALSVGLPALGVMLATLPGDLGSSMARLLIQGAISFLLVLFVVASGYLAIASQRGLPTFGYGTAFRLAVKAAHHPSKVHADALLRQEVANQVRQMRNEAAFQTLRNGVVMICLVLVLNFLARIVSAGSGGMTTPRPGATADETRAEGRGAS